MHVPKVLFIILYLRGKIIERVYTSGNVAAAPLEVAATDVAV